MKKIAWKKVGWNLLRAVGLIYLFLLISPVAGLDIPRVVTTIQSQPGIVIRYTWIGIANGAIFAIVALGYTMVYGIIQLINFAHGDVYMMSTFMALTVIAALGTTNQSAPLTILITLVITIIVTVLFGGGLNATDRTCGVPAVAQCAAPGSADLGDWCFVDPGEPRPDLGRARLH